MSNEGGNRDHFPPETPQNEERIREQLARILASNRFRRAEALKCLLQFVVEETLIGRGQRLKAQTIAVKALGRGKDFDPKADPVVSIQAGRLRRALANYYETTGSEDSIVITLPTGQYAAYFELRSASTDAKGPEPVSTSIATSTDGLGLPAVAVCDFASLSVDPDQGFFAAGITQEIVTELTRFQELRVIACQKTGCDLAGSLDGRRCDLGARFVLRGTVRRTSESARITAQLVDALDGHQIWAERYDRQLSASDLFQVQDEIAQRVVAAVADNYGVISRTLCKEVRSQEPREFRSYEAVLHFRHYQYHVLDAARDVAIEALREAVQRDPEYALAWAMLSETTADAYGLRIDTNPNVFGVAKEQARRALSLDPECQHAHWSMAYAHFHARERKQVIREAEETIALNPNNGYLAGISAWAMALVGEWDRGLSMLRRIMESNPHYPTWFHLAPYLKHYRSNDYERALFHAEKFNTHLAWDLILRAAALGQLDRRDDAKAAVAGLELRFPKAAADPAHYVRGYIFIEDLVEEVVDGLRQAGWSDKTPTAPSTLK